MILLFLQGQLVQKKTPLSIDQVLHSVTLLLLHVAVQTFYTANNMYMYMKPEKGCDHYIAHYVVDIFSWS